MSSNLIYNEVQVTGRLYLQQHFIRGEWQSGTAGLQIATNKSTHCRAMRHEAARTGL